MSPCELVHFCVLMLQNSRSEVIYFVCACCRQYTSDSVFGLDQTRLCVMTLRNFPYFPWTKCHFKWSVKCDFDTSTSFQIAFVSCITLKKKKKEKNSASNVKPDQKKCICVKFILRKNVWFLNYIMLWTLSNFVM